MLPGLLIVLERLEVCICIWTPTTWNVTNSVFQKHSATKQNILGSHIWPMGTSCNLWAKACLVPPYLATDSAEPWNEEQRAGGDEEWLVDRVGEKVGCET